MIRHVVVFRWKPEATAEQKALVATELGEASRHRAVDPGFCDRP